MMLVAWGLLVTKSEHTFAELFSGICSVSPKK
jgi:hypothetical protein